MVHRLLALPLSDDRYELTIKERIALRTLHNSIKRLDITMAKRFSRGMNATENVYTHFKYLAKKQGLYCEDCTLKLFKEHYEKSKRHIMFTDQHRRWASDDSDIHL